MSDTIGQRLKQAREEHNLSLEQVEEITRIRAHYLHALESDDYSVMPSAVQARGFLRNYSEFLGLNVDEIVLELQRAHTAVEEDELSGPLPNLDSAAPLPEESQEEPAARPFWISWLARLRKTESASEAAPPEVFPIQELIQEPEPAAPPVEESAPVVETPAAESPKKRGRKKKIYITEPAVPPEDKEEKQDALLVEVPVPVILDEESENEAGQDELLPTQQEAQPEAKRGEEEPTLWARIKSFFNTRAKKAEAPKDENPPLEAAQAEVPNEAEGKSKKGLWGRVASLFRIRVNRPARQEVRQEKSAAKVEPAPEDVPPEELLKRANEIFSAIGVELRQRREMISLTPEEVERHTRLRVVFLNAMEKGDFNQLPSPVQTRGMLANYAQFLDLDSDALLLKFAEAIQIRHRAKYPDRSSSPNPQTEVISSLPPLRSFIAGDLLFGLAIVAVLFGLAIWGVQRMIAIQTDEQQGAPTAPSIPQVLSEATLLPSQPAETPQVEDTPMAAETQDVIALPTSDSNANVQISVVAMERAFVRVLVDGTEKFNGRVLPGDILPFEAVNQIEVLTGSASALRVTYNGRDLGPMGGFGEVVDRIYTATGIATPTATLPPTSTNTPPATPTLSVTQTPSPIPPTAVTP